VIPRLSVAPLSQTAVVPTDGLRQQHFNERRILQSIEICLNHFPEEVQEKRKETKIYPWYSRKLTAFH
jgi:hypothetical protein